jgi:hypothetical protein
LGGYIRVSKTAPTVSCIGAYQRRCSPKQEAHRQGADLPRFGYKVDGKIEDMVRDDAKFKPFASEVRRDLESVLARYDIDDKATLRQILGEFAQLDGNYEAALARVVRVKAL